MNKKELQKRLKLHEWEDMEFKEAKNELPKNIWETVSAFANSEGGYIAFGISDNEKGIYHISGVENVEKLQNDFLSSLRGEKFSLQLSSKGHLLNYSGKKVVLFKINSMPVHCKPIYYGGDIRNTFVRRGSGDYRCSKEEINRMLREASELSSDSMLLDGFTMKDIDKDTIETYKTYLRYNTPLSPFINLRPKELLLKLGCIKYNKANKSETFTMAGLLLFGKEDSIRSRFPAYEFDIYLIRSNLDEDTEKRWDDRKIYEKNLIQIYLDAMEYLKSKIEIPFALAPDHTTRTEEVPIVIALREAFVNMLIHRDYFERGQSRIKIYSEHIEMYNPGSAPQSVEDIIENESTEPRNPIIAKAFRLIGWAETAGTGMIKIFREWKKLNYDVPVIQNNISGYSFKMTFPTIYKAHQLVISPAKAAEQVPTKMRTSTEQDPIVNKILAYTVIPRKLKEIMTKAGLKHRPSFIENYLKPLINSDLISLIVPDKPNSPKQKYVITDKGKIFLNRK